MVNLRLKFIWWVRFLLEFGFKTHYRVIREELRNIRGRVLDLGCGIGNFSTAFPEACYYGIDIDEAVIEYAKRHYAGQYSPRDELSVVASPSEESLRATSAGRLCGAQRAEPAVPIQTVRGRTPRIESQKTNSSLPAGRQARVKPVAFWCVGKRNLRGWKEFIVSDAKTLPFRNNYFDSVLAIGLLHHLEGKDVEAVVKEIHRVVKRRGKVLIIEDYHPSFFQSPFINTLYLVDAGGKFRSAGFYKKVFKRYFFLEKSYPVKSGFWRYNVFVLSPTRVC